MRKVILSDELCKQLQEDLLEVEVLSETGKTLGIFIPTPDAEIVRNALYDHAQSLFTEAELRQPSRKGGGSKLADFLKQLEAS